MPCYLALLIGVAMTVVHSSSALEGRYFLSVMFLSDIVICNAHSNAVMCKNLRYKLRLRRKRILRRRSEIERVGDLQQL